MLLQNNAKDQWGKKGTNDKKRHFRDENYKWSITFEKCSNSLIITVIQILKKKVNFFGVKLAKFNKILMTFSVCKMIER